MGERWPPTYDEESLLRQIRDLVDSGRLLKEFYDSGREFDDVCQGDILHLPTSVPLLGPDGQPGIHDDIDHWMVVGNTCDFERPTVGPWLTSVEWTQLVPIVDMGADLEDYQLEALARYQYARRFYVPPWPNAPAGHHHVADFLRPVALHKAAFASSSAVVVARLTRLSWFLFHSCIVRFLARDDGREDM